MSLKFNLEDKVSYERTLGEVNQENRIEQDRLKHEATMASELQRLVFNLIGVYIFITPANKPVGFMNFGRDNIAFFVKERSLAVRYNPVPSSREQRDNDVICIPNTFADLVAFLEDVRKKYKLFAHRLKDVDSPYGNGYKSPSSETIKTLMASGEWDGKKRVPLPPLPPDKELFTMAKIAEIYSLTLVPERYGYVGKNPFDDCALPNGFLLYIEGASVGDGRDTDKTGQTKVYPAADVAKRLAVPKEYYEGYRLQCDLMGGELIEQDKEPE